jgi:hypothetical protein
VKISTLNSPAKREAAALTERTKASNAANRVLVEQELEPMAEAAAIYFQDFTATGWKKRRNWLLPVETIYDLKDEYCNAICSHLDWFKAEIRKHQQRGSGSGNALLD